MRINRRLQGTVADRPIDTVVTQGVPQAIPAQDVRRTSPSSMVNTIERIASMLNGSAHAGPDIQLADTPAYGKG